MEFLSCFLLCLALSTNCLGTAISTSPAIDIEVGENGSSFARRNADQLKIDRHPTRLNFYEIRFPVRAKGSATLNSGTRKSVIENILSITGTEDMDFKDEGLSEFSINCAISATELISHDDARMKFFSMLQDLTRAGWKTTIPRGAPRLLGKDMTNYLLRSRQEVTLDSSYLPSLDEWMRLPSLTGWEFYANHTYLTVAFTREHTLTDPRKLGAYLVSFELKNEAEEFRGHVGGSGRNRWKEILPKELTKLAQERGKKETELRRQGAKIDETYVDPPIPDLSKKQ